MGAGIFQGAHRVPLGFGCLAPFCSFVNRSQRPITRDILPSYNELDKMAVHGITDYSGTRVVGTVGFLNHSVAQKDEQISPYNKGRIPFHEFGGKSPIDFTGSRICH